MRICFALPLLFWTTGLYAAGEAITPTSVIATSEFGEVDVFGDGMFSAVFAKSLIDGSGLVNEDSTPCTEDVVLNCLHDFDANSNSMWTAGSFDAGIPGGEAADELEPPNVDDQILEFDLGRVVRLTDAFIWQQNQGGAFGALAPRRGVEEFEVFVSKIETGDNFTSVGKFILEQSLGDTNLAAQSIALEGAALEGARRVRFNIDSVTSPDPLPEEPHPDFEFVGLSEVRFRASLPGDADLNNAVEFADFLLLSDNFGSEGGWAQGDFDLDGMVQFSDFLLLSDAFGTVGIAAESVPEPTSSSLVGILVFLICLRRARRLGCYECC